MKGPVTEDLVEIATQAARWGADQELEACVQIMFDRGLPDSAKALLRVRRPKPPSEKEQALQALERIDRYAVSQISAYAFHDDLIEDVATIRKVLETVPEGAQ
jgi:hypothetical protein